MKKIERQNLINTVKEIRTLADLRNLSLELSYIQLCEKNLDANWLDVRVCEVLAEEDGSQIYDIRKDLMRILGA